MSRILFSTQVGAATIPIALGWDRRLGQCFLSINVMVLDDDECDDERFVPILEASGAGMSANLSPADCMAILAKANIAAPPGAFDVLADHVRKDAGNLIVQLDDSGKVEVLFDESARAQSSS